jgi:hypothetical protein
MDTLVKYIGKKETLAFKRDKIYIVLSVEEGIGKKWYRIMTELHDDYLFPPEVFEIVEEINNDH